MAQAKTEVALQFSECCVAEVALQHWLFCSAEVIFTKTCAATSEKLRCNIEKAALQESGAFLQVSCGFQAPTFRHPRLGPAEQCLTLFHAEFLPELCGEVDPEFAPVRDLCCALGSTEQSTLRGREQGEKVPRKGVRRASRGDKKEKRMRPHTG